VRCESRQEAGLHERRLAAAGRTVDEADRERGVGGGLFDARFPEADRFRQSVAIARAGQQLQEKVGVVRVERTKALGDNLDWQAVGRSGGGGVGGGVAAGVCAAATAGDAG